MSSSYDSAIIDTALIEHPDLVRLSRGIRYMYVKAIVWSRVHRTDGLIPKHMLHRITDEPEADAGALELVRVGRWVDHDENWEIVGFLDNQMSAAQVAQERDQARARKRRQRSLEMSRVTDGVSHGVSHATDPSRPDLTGPDPKGREGREKTAATPGPSGGPVAVAARLTDAQFDAMSDEVFDAWSNGPAWRQENGWRPELAADGYPRRSRKP